MQSTEDRLRQLVEEAIASGQVRLPPERDLARELRTSRGVLRRALDVLEAEGQISRHVGRGTFAVPSGPGRELPLRDIVDATNPAEVMEVRLIVEPAIAGLAASRATPAQIARMSRCIVRSDAAVDTASYERWDGQLHEAIAEASHNALLFTIFRIINATRETRIWGRTKERSLTPDRRELYRRQHSAVVSAVSERDPDKAEALMRTHLEAVAAAVRAVTRP